MTTQSHWLYSLLSGHLEGSLPAVTPMVTSPKSGPYAASHAVEVVADPSFSLEHRDKLSRRNSWGGADRKRRYERALAAV